MSWLRAGSPAVSRKTAQGNEWRSTAGNSYGIWRFDGAAGLNRNGSSLSQPRREQAPLHRTARTLSSDPTGAARRKSTVGMPTERTLKSVTEPTGRPQGTPRWSPDGHQIAYDADGRRRECGTSRWCMQTAGCRRRLTTSPQSGAGEYPELVARTEVDVLPLESSWHPGNLSGLISGGVPETDDRQPD